MNAVGWPGRHLLVALVVLGTFLLGCVHSGPNHLKEAVAHKERGDYSMALTSIRAEIADPVLSDRVYLANIRVIAIDLLHKSLARGEEPSAEHDAEARRYYTEAVELAAEHPETLLTVYDAMGNYFSHTRRNAQAIAYFQQYVRTAEETREAFSIFVAHDAMSTAYHDQGELRLSRYHVSLALKAMKHYYFGSAEAMRRVESREWGVMLDVLRKWMDQAAVARRPEVVRELWHIAQRVVDRHADLPEHWYLRAAGSFALAGDTKTAWEIRKEALELARPRPSSLAQIDIACNEATLLVSEGENRAEEGVLAAARCARLSDAGGIPMGSAGYRLVARAYEHAGQLDKAATAYRQSIEIHEKDRRTWEPLKRAAIFRTVARESYWGLIRVLARKAVSGDAAAVNEAITASELLRARQLGDLLAERSRGERDGQRSAIAAKVQKLLAPGDLVLAFSFMRGAVVLYALTKDRSRVFILSDQPMAMVRDVQDLARSLRSKSEDPKLIAKKAGGVSETVFAPVRQLLERKKRLIVLPDGPLNEIPFEVLARAKAGYRPLVRDVEVRLAPSLEYLALERKALPDPEGGVLALADPKYASDPSIGGLTPAELRSVTRGSRYLSHFNPLPETREEARAVTEPFVHHRLLVGSEATESRLTAEDLSRYRFVHLATHGVLGGQLPGLVEPALVLAEEPGQDGLLTASEAQRLRLNAELTVLSACSTGRGVHYTGEGVMGMSRAFLIAGSRAVLVSLWPVDSAATVRLMTNFYRRIANRESLDAALRNAKIDMMLGRTPPASGAGERGLTVSEREQGKKTTQPWMHPYFWSAFVLVGGAS